MIKFRQKSFSEYDAMRQLYVEIMKDPRNRNKFGVIDSSALIPVLRGNNLIIEKFTQATRVFGKDRYRMYLRIGAKAKLPDAIRLPQYSEQKSLGQLQMGFEYGIKPDFGNGGGQGGNGNQYNPQQPQGTPTLGQNPNPVPDPNLNPNPVPNPNSTSTPSNSNNNQKGGNWKKKNKKFSFIGKEEQRIFGKGRNKNNNNNNNGGGGNFIKTSFKPQINFLNYNEYHLLGDVLKYDKKERSLVIEFSSIQDAIRSIDLLPFGLGFNKIYLLNA